MYKIFLIFSFIFISSLLLIGCGLPSYNVVEPPVISSVSPNIGFTAPADDSNIDGYEIYYKLYKSGDVKITSDKEQFDVSSSDFSYDFGKTKPVQLGFQRLNYGDLITTETKSYPLISSDSSVSINLQAGQEVQIYLNDGNDRILINNSDRGIPLRIAKDGSYYKPFSNNVIESDIDNNGVTNTDSQYSVSFVAFSYVSSIITNYQSSYPVFLGTITDIPNN